MTLATYFDASGDAQQPILGVAGFVARPDQWTAFEQSWRSILDSERVAELHMKDFAHSQGPFKEWKGDEKRRAAFLERLTGAISRHTLKSVAVSLFMDHYRDFNSRFLLRESLGAPYAFASLFAINLAREWRNQRHPGEPISYVFERGDNEQGDLGNTLRRWTIADTFDVTFMPKRWAQGGEPRHHYPLQACDFLAYECWKASRAILEKDDPNTGVMAKEIQARKSLLRVAPRQRDFTWRFIDAGLLSEFCKGFGVQRRVEVTS